MQTARYANEMPCDVRANVPVAHSIEGSERIPGSLTPNSLSNRALAVLGSHKTMLRRLARYGNCAETMHRCRLKHEERLTLRSSAGQVTHRRIRRQYAMLFQLRDNELVLMSQ